MAAFIYRHAGSPQTTGNSNFTDTNGSQFQKEIAWLSSKGITTGYQDGSFKPREAITREAMAAFLYRYDSSPNIGDSGDRLPPQTLESILAARTAGPTVPYVPEKCMLSATAWGTSLDGAEGRMQHADVVNMSGAYIAMTYVSANNGTRGGTLNVYGCLK